jgi:hypothetical protein
LSHPLRGVRRIIGKKVEKTLSGLLLTNSYIYNNLITRRDPNTRVYPSRIDLPEGG